MADTNETTNDIIAEMKREAAQIFPALPIAVLKLATRIEAAHDHDIAIATEASARAVVGACVKQREAERKCVALREAIDYLCERMADMDATFDPSEVECLRDALAAPATTEKSSAVGNGAKLREAVSEIVLLTVKAGRSISCDVACGIIASKAKHALKQPPRNCDRFATLPDALAAWRDIDPREAGPFDLWLFAPATEGGAK